MARKKTNLRGARLACGTRGFSAADGRESSRARRRLCRHSHETMQNLARSLAKEDGAPSRPGGAWCINGEVTSALETPTPSAHVKAKRSSLVRGLVKTIRPH